MRQLDELNLLPAIHDVVEAGTPFLGVCLGMQLLFERHDEGDVAGLGLLKGRVRISATRRRCRTSAGTNRPSPNPLPGLQPGDSHYFYFLHSFVADPDDATDIAATCLHGESFPSVVMTMFGAHSSPGKSSRDGLALVASWIESVRQINAGRMVTS